MVLLDTGKNLVIKIKKDKLFVSLNLYVKVVYNR